MLETLLHGPENLAPEPYLGNRLMSPSSHGQEFSTEWDIDRAYTEGLERCAMVDRCTHGLAEKAASVPLMVWERKDGAAKGTPVPGHELNLVLNHPDPDPVQGSRDKMVTRTFLHYLLAGTSLTGIRRGVDIRKRGSTKIVGLKAEDPRLVYPVADDDFLIAQWNYRTNMGQTKAWAREDMVAWRRHDPRSELWGRSVLQSLALNVDSSVESAKTQLLRVARDGRPGMILQDPSLASGDRPAAEDAERRLNARQRTHRGGIMLLGADEKLIAGGMSDTDLGLLKTMSWDRDMIAIAYGYLPAGFSNDASTYSNASIFVLYEWGLVQATLARWTETLTAFLFSREDQMRFFIAADYSGVQALQDANMEKLKAFSEAAFKGLSTADLIRAFDLPIAPGPFDNAILVPAKLRDLAQKMEAPE